jgi:demethylmenaquinone methyltransferase/2-methoxy-6-polyprenyl-1,4-benzoquinol methylase
VDKNPVLLSRAREISVEKGIADRVSFEEGDYCTHLPFDDGEFDWVWSSDCLGYLPINDEVLRVIRPAGSLVISFWSSEQLLPGYPVLESKLRGTRSGLAPFSRNARSEEHPLRLLSTLRDAGLTGTTASTFVASVHGPLSEEIRRGMADILEMRWQGAEEELDADDAALFHQLTDPDSADFILNLPDYYGFFTYSVFRGCVTPRGEDV